MSTLKSLIGQQVIIWNDDLLEEADALITERRTNLAGNEVVVLRLLNNDLDLYSANLRFVGGDWEEIKASGVPINLVKLKSGREFSDPIGPDDCIPFGRRVMYLKREG